MATTASNSRIRASALAKAFGTRVLWRGLSFSVDAGEVVAVTGPSGSGKSTLLNCIGLLQPVTAGSIRLGALELTGLRGRGARCFRRDHLGYLFQNYALVDNATVAENLRIAVDARPRRHRASSKELDGALERVGLGGRGKEPVYQLSGGEQQRLALARLMVRRPSIVLADEPTGALDHANADMVIEALRGLADEGAAVLVATHSDHVVSTCDRELVLALHASATRVEKA